MNRQIKFRGKRIKDGEWVYGRFYMLNNSPLEAARIGRKQSYYFERIMGADEDHESRGAINLGEVDPDTIGEFTGLQDCHGTDIYEGDILKMLHPDKRRDLKYEVYWNVVCAGWWLRDEYTNGPLASALDSHKHEIVGNVYDNPDLLKGGDQ